MLDQQTSDRFFGERTEADDLRPRADRRQLLVGARADEDQHRTGRRLFERFQKCVGPFDIQIVGVVDDRDLAAPHERFQTDLVAKPFVHPMLFVADEGGHGDEALVRRFAHEFEIGMSAGGHLLARRAALARIKARLGPLLA